MGDLEQAAKDLERFIRLEKTLCVHGAKALRDLYEAWICLEGGVNTKAIDLLEGALPVLKKGTANRVPYAINALCIAWMNEGEISRAQDLAAQGIAWNERFGNQDQLIWSYRSAAKACLLNNDPEKATPFLVRATELSEKYMMKPHMAWNHSVWAFYWEKQGNRPRADTCTKKSQSMWMDMECPYQTKKIS
jgi:tetratricopeptide (TPR) repeat protein